jgi:hypothetical protein
VDVDEHDDVGCPVADVFVIVARTLAGFRRHRHTRLADELAGRLVEADDRPIGVGRLRVELQHIFHSGDVLGVELGNAPHLLLPRLEVYLGEATPNGLVGELSVCRETDHLVGQELQGPPRTTTRWPRAGNRNQQRFFFRRKLALRPRARCFG